MNIQSLQYGCTIMKHNEHLSCLESGTMQPRTLQYMHFCTQISSMEV